MFYVFLLNSIKIFSDDETESANSSGTVSNIRNHLNLRAATVHVLGDVIQSFGVFIVSIMIWFKPEWKILDPIASILFCAIVVYTTIMVLKDTIKILMEGRPSRIRYTH